MIRTWSLESALVRAQSALAVAVQGVWDAVTNRPVYANDHPIPGCPNASDCRDYGCAGDCSEATEALESPAAAGQLAAEICRAHGSEMCFVCDEDDDNLWVHPRDFEAAPDLDDEVPNPYEPGLTDDELVGLRGLLQERYETSAVVPRNGPAEHPAGGLTHSPESPQPAPQLDWHGWAEPAICEVLAEHHPVYSDANTLVWCVDKSAGHIAHAHFDDEADWREHVAPIIADRIACDPVRAIAALHNHKPK